MLKPLVLAALLAALVLPAAAQEGEGVPLLRVYIDAPYFYDILANVTDSSDPKAQHIDLTVEGKEVGASSIVYSCKDGAYSQTVTSDWTGNAANFIPAALMAYRDLYC